jgi:hypothetical protein
MRFVVKQDEGKQEYPVFAYYVIMSALNSFSRFIIYIE